MFTGDAINHQMKWRRMGILTGRRSGSHLAEGIILQAIEDLYDDNEREDCIAFFRSRDFTVCAEIAGIDMASRGRLLDFVKLVMAASARHRVRHEPTRNPDLLFFACIALNPLIYQFADVIFSLAAPVMSV